MMSCKIKERGELDVISHVESMGKQRGKGAIQLWTKVISNIRFEKKWSIIFDTLESPQQQCFRVSTERAKP